MIGERRSFYPRQTAQRVICSTELVANGEYVKCTVYAIAYSSVSFSSTLHTSKQTFRSRWFDIRLMYLSLLRKAILIIVIDS